MANSNLNNEQVILKIKNGEFLYREKSGKSDVWLNFEEVVDKEVQFIGYVICHKYLIKQVLQV